MKYVSIINDLELNTYLCPNCHCATFFEHNSTDYRGWHKCTHCGFMCLSKDHTARIKKEVYNHYKIPLDEQDKQK